MKIKFCSNCLMPSTRPRISFNKVGICNACEWASEKKEIVDWKARELQLKNLCDKFKIEKSGKFQCILPASGGKDSSYVADQMQNKWGLNGLSVTIHPPLSYHLGNQNLENFIFSGFDNIRITPNPEVGRRMARYYFEEQGQPLMAWIMSVQTIIFRIAVVFDIPFVMFGEEGEMEYGGSTNLKNKYYYDIDDCIKLYLSGNNPLDFLGELTPAEKFWWTFPDENEFKNLKPIIAKYSYFENWDPYEHYLFAKENCGMLETEQRCIGTYNNFAQTDTKLYDLHAYLMYLKFGFGRCCQDVGIDIRRGALSRKQGLSLVKKFDGEYPESLIPDFLEYFRMTQDEFDKVLDRHANKSLFKKINGRWVPDFEII